MTNNDGFDLSLEEYIECAEEVMGERFTDWQRAVMANIYNRYDPFTRIEKEEKMTKTLADYTPEERQKTIGMWATNHNYTGEGEWLGVIACIQNESMWLIHPQIHGEWSCFTVDSVTPRFDLPRAWETDGNPPTGKWKPVGEAEILRGL